MNIEKVKNIIEKILSDLGYVLVELLISKDNKIVVYMDNAKGISIDDCIKVSMMIEEKLDRNEEDYELEVSSPGLNNPLKIPFQYKKNIGNEIKVTKINNENLRGRIIFADDEKIELELLQKENNIITLPYKEIKTAYLILKF